MNSESTLKGILNGVDLIIEEELLPPGVRAGTKPPFYMKKTTILNLIKKKKLAGSFKGLCERSYAKIKDNFKTDHFRVSDTGNWVLRKELETRHEKEVKLERDIVALDDNWANQVSTASGLVGSTAGKRRAIDLVRKLQSDTYQFIELKVTSDTPVAAAIEVLEYALLYIFSRKHCGSLKIPNDIPLMSAKKIELRVLAPGTYFTDQNRNRDKKLDLKWFESALDSGIATFCKASKAGVEMDFRFLQFDKDFTWSNAKASESGRAAFLEQLRADVNAIHPVYPD